MSKTKRFAVILWAMAVAVMFRVVSNDVTRWVHIAFTLITSFLILAMLEEEQR